MKHSRPTVNWCAESDNQTYDQRLRTESGSAYNISAYRFHQWVAGLRDVRLRFKTSGYLSMAARLKCEMLSDAKGDFNQHS
jgi:hypothetical protein